MIYLTTQEFDYCFLNNLFLSLRSDGEDLSPYHIFLADGNKAFFTKEFFILLDKQVRESVERQIQNQYEVFVDKIEIQLTFLPDNKKEALLQSLLSETTDWIAKYYNYPHLEFRQQASESYLTQMIQYQWEDGRAEEYLRWHLDCHFGYFPPKPFHFLDPDIYHDPLLYYESTGCIIEITKEHKLAFNAEYLIAQIKIAEYLTQILVDFQPNEYSKVLATSSQRLLLLEELGMLDVLKNRYKEDFNEINNSRLAELISELIGGNPNSIRKDLSHIGVNSNKKIDTTKAINRLRSCLAKFGMDLKRLK